MDADAVVKLAQEALLITLVVSAPPILVSLIVGLVISVFQAATQIQEQTLTFVPKTLMVFLTLMLVGGWILGYVVRFASSMFQLLETIRF